MKYKSLMVMPFLMLLTAFSGVPKQEFSNYVTNFNSAKSTTQDIILGVWVTEESKYDGSHEQLAKLEEKRKALNARLDADDLFEIQIQNISEIRDPERDQIINLRFDYQDFVNTLDAGEDVNTEIESYNKNLLRMNVNPEKRPDPVIHLPNNSHTADASDYSILKLLGNQTTEHISKYNNITEQINATIDVKVEYKKVLNSTAKAFNNLNFAVQNQQYVLQTDFIIDVLDLRAAYLKLQEAKQK